LNVFKTKSIFSCIKKDLLRKAWWWITDAPCGVMDITLKAVLKDTKNPCGQSSMPLQKQPPSPLCQRRSVFRLSLILCMGNCRPNWNCHKRHETNTIPYIPTVAFFTSFIDCDRLYKYII